MTAGVKVPIRYGPAMADMIDARDATLTRLLDDAAMLPPTALGPAEALRAHLRLADGGSAWMQGRLVVPLAELAELEPHLPDDGAPGLVVGLPRAGGALIGAIGSDLAALAPVLADDRVRVEAMQVGLVGTHAAQTIERLCDALDGAGVDASIPLAVEVAFADRPAGEVLATVDALAAGASRPLVAHTPAGVDTAGDTELAGLLIACAEAQVPLTLGAGLVDPLPTVDGGHHGLLNVVAAAVMAHRGARLDAVRSVLAVPPTRVRLGSGALILDEEVVESEWIAACREDLLTAIDCTDVPAAVAGLASMGAIEPSGERT